eukprot:TRINITY_DN2930_c2_g1_i1.p1 TRINITY_DN2930_c2_g1~~TRINITY_DN2930_c2_g1_i1.p1  ORF type:complete len:211 (+),score=72.02 TRINITY_DN2930_c2_g1_i1:35-634(+)
MGLTVGEQSLSMQEREEFISKLMEQEKVLELLYTRAFRNGSVSPNTKVNRRKSTSSSKSSSTLSSKRKKQTRGKRKVSASSNSSSTKLSSAATLSPSPSPSPSASSSRKGTGRFAAMYKHHGQSQSNTVESAVKLSFDSIHGSFSSDSNLNAILEEQAHEIQEVEEEEEEDDDEVENDEDDEEKGTPKDILVENWIQTQ